MEETLLEYADSRGAALSVDREAGVIRGVKILGSESRNGRSYPHDTLVRARELYEGAKVNVNHPKGSPLGPRDYQDRIGLIRNVSVVGDSGLYGDLHFNPRHGMAGQLEWDARHAPENVGLSHNVMARTSRRDEQVVVEAITRVVSVDLVADPASTHGLYEQVAEIDAVQAREADWTRVTLEQLRAARPDLLEQNVAEERAEILRLKAEIANLRTSPVREEADAAQPRIRARDQHSVDQSTHGRHRPIEDADSFVKAISHKT
ncbi:MAG: hypothetical protein K8U03_06675 [Planctomycetia bacterium]|nr:hypothetical protein [Planctomycetia bacterium]